MIYKLFFQILLFLCAFCTPVYAVDDTLQPEKSTNRLLEAHKAEGHDFMIVTANSHATKAGYDILKRGGSAADAAIAAQLVLGLVEPQSSGIGGGAFVLYYDATRKELTTLDGREMAPSLAGPFLFFENGEPMAFKNAQLSGKSVGVSGVPRLLEHLHQAHGKRTWMELFESAKSLSQNGFEVSPRLANMINHHKDDLAKFPETAFYFLDENKQGLKEGRILKNPAYFETLSRFAFSGVHDFYEGDIALNITDTVQNAYTGAGFLTLNDMRSYQLKKRKPLCAPYREHIICSFGEPSSGGLTVLQTLGLLEPYNLKEMGANNPESWSLIAQASALAFADRNKYMADSDFVNTPGTALLDPEYLEQRRSFMNINKPLEEIAAGKPSLWDGPLFATSNSIDKPGTSHISIIDKEGNVLSMTTTIESAFGSHMMVDGFLLNNQLTDFSFRPFDADGNLIANMVEGGKRPRSSMSPTIVFDSKGKPVLVIGSAGGSRIIGYVLQRLIAVLDWDMSINEALEMDHILARSSKIEFETSSSISEALEQKGFETEIKDLNSGLTAIQLRGNTYIGAADPRREGVAMGE